MKKRQKLSLLILMIFTVFTFASCSGTDITSIKKALSASAKSENYKIEGSMNINLPAELVSTLLENASTDLPDLDVAITFDTTVGQTEKGNKASVGNYSINALDIILKSSFYVVKDNKNESSTAYFKLPQFLKLALQKNADYVEISSTDQKLLEKSLNSLFEVISYVPNGLTADKAMDNLVAAAEKLEIKDLIKSLGSTKITSDGKTSYGKKFQISLDGETLAKIFTSIQEDDEVYEALKPFLFNNSTEEDLIAVYEELGLEMTSEDLRQILGSSIMMLIGPNGVDYEFVVSNKGLLHEKLSIDTGLLGLSFPMTLERTYSYSNKDIILELPKFDNTLTLEDLQDTVAADLLPVGDVVKDTETEETTDSTESNLADLYEAEIAELLAEDVTLDAEPKDYFFTAENAKKHEYTTESNGAESKFSITPVYFGEKMIQAKIEQPHMTSGVLYNADADRVAVVASLIGDDMEKDNTSIDVPEMVDTILAGPLKLGHSWVDPTNTQKSYIFTVDEKIETPAGEFDVIGVRTYLLGAPEIFLDRYFAKGHGFVLIEQAPIEGVTTDVTSTTLTNIAE